MRPETFFVKYISVHNCFLHFSARWLEKFKDTNNLSQVLKLEYGLKKCGYFSCSPESHTSTSNGNNDDGNNNNNIVGISATYAQKLGLKDKEKVTISVCSNVCSVSRISVSAVTADDWEILEMNSDLVQLSLLDQVRVVWGNQILVVWVSRSVYVSLRVDGFESDCIAGLLEPLSDVVVTPPGTSALVTESSFEHASLKRDLLKQTSQTCDGEIEDFSPGQPFMSVLWDILRSYVSGSSSRKEDALVKDPLGTESKRQTITVLQNRNHRPLPAVYRVHPLCLPSSGDERKSGDYLLLHPYNVFVRRCCMPSVDAGFLNHTNGALTCKLIRIPDPTDSEDLHSKRGGKFNELHRKENAAVCTASVHVQLYVIEDIYDILSDSFKECLDKVTVSTRTGHDSLLVSSVARVVLDTRIGARVNLEVVTSAARCVVSEIQITPLGNLEKSAKELETLFRRYIAEEVRTRGVLINSKSFLPLQATACSAAHVYVSLLPSDMEYAILDPDSVRKCKFTVKENASNLVYPSFDKELPTSDICRVHFGSYFKTLLSEGITTLELSLHLSPLVRPLSLRANFVSDNILILGTAGSGKSTLARTICRELEKPPHFVHCVEIQCKPLKGKKVETLQKLISQNLRECVYYQPAVLIFDDLESIAGIGGSAPGQSVSEDSYYYTRVGERLSELVEELQSSHSVSVIATAPSLLKISSALVAPRGRHIFKTVLEIPELNKGDRLDILKSIVSQRSAVTTDSIVPLNWSKMAGRSEGYVMQDLVDLADKAIFQACKKAVSAEGHTEAVSLELDNSDFEEALNNSVPLLQRGVEFYRGSSHSWDDIGGLSDVKKILIEVLQWPSQYPEIFENAPLRVQSGLLLYGAPGTGKTLLASAVAKECGLKFISIKGPELLSKYIGASEEAVRNIFQKAQSAKPCVLFFDEFDSLAPRRGHDSTGVTDRVVNQLLTQLDGVESLHGVSVVAATSRPDLIDPALLRPGRLDRIIKCPLPDRDDRLSILQALSHKLVLSDDVNFGEIADETEGFTGADLQAVLYTALLQAVERNVALCEDVDNEDVKQEPVIGDVRAKPEKVTSGPVVTQANLRAALKDTKPSLSDTEKLRYHLIYAKFERSRGGTSAEDVTAMPQRATLA